LDPSDKSGSFGHRAFNPGFKTMTLVSAARSRRLQALASIFLLAPLILGSIGGALAAPGADWSVIGQQGLVRFVVVPNDQASNLAAYEHQIDHLCEPERTCFLNFYTNSTGAAAAVPLPDAIANEATATFRHSMKNGARVFMWSCRLKVPGTECF
jgi:hypothetical protein